MKKVCTDCGSEEFYVEMRERLRMPRKPKISNYEKYVSRVICAECGSRYTV